MPAVTEYRLSPSASDDLDAIWDYTVRIWSVDQAENYIRAIADSMSLLVRHSEMARERLEIRPPVRVYRSGSISSSIGSKMAGWMFCVSCMRGKTGWPISANDPVLASGGRGFSRA